MRRFLIAVGLALALAACGAGTAARHGQAYAGSASTASATAFTKARSAWKQSATVAAANVSRYLTQAARDLQPATGRGFAAAERELTTLASMPETGATRSQISQATADVQALDGFFGTPGMTPNG
jgi:glucose/arabinose dehydrogenase